MFQIPDHKLSGTKVLLSHVMCKYFEKKLTIIWNDS